MRENAEVRQIFAGLVVIDPGFGQPRLARVLEAPDVRCAGLAVFVIGVDADQVAAAVGRSDCLLLEIAAAPFQLTFAFWTRNQVQL